MRVLPLEWRRVDWVAGEVRLDSGTTKNGEGRVFPFTAALRQVLETQRQVQDTLTGQGAATTSVFCYPSGPKAGHRFSGRVYHYAWARAG